MKANWPMMKTWNCQMSVDAERMKLMKAPKETESKEHLLAHLELPDTMPWNGLELMARNDDGSCYNGAVIELVDNST